MNIAICGGRLIDPGNQRDGEHDLYIDGASVVAIGSPPPGFQAERVIDARGSIVCPGFIDLCARLREPGQEYKASIASETLAAARAGITTLICPPDTDPVVDETAVAKLIQRRADAAGFARVLPLGALTRGLAGERLAGMAALKEAGCVGVSNASQPIINTLVLRRSLEYAATFDLMVFLTPMDPWLTGNAHDGAVATRLGLNGIPVAAETAVLARDLAVVEDLGIRAHFCRLSSARAVEMVAQAQRRGLPVSADVSAHHLHLTEADLEGFDSLCHVLPPLRSLQDREGLRTGLVQGALGAICSDHQPHEENAKQAPFGTTEPGISGLDTLLGLALHLVEEKVLSLPAVIERLTLGPARILGLEFGQLSVGAKADVCIFAPKRSCSSEMLVSRGRNSPFSRWNLRGRVTHTLLAGRVVYEAEP